MYLFCNSLQELTNLNTLDLSFAPWTSDDLEVLSKITSLATLDLSFCTLGNLPERFVFVKIKLSVLLTANINRILLCHSGLVDQKTKPELSTTINIWCNKKYKLMILLLCMVCLH